MAKQALFNLVLKVFLFLSPIFFFRTQHLNVAQGMFFIFASFALFGISLGLEAKRKLSNPWLALFLLWALIRVFVGGDFGNEANEWFNFWISSAGFIYVFAGVLLFYTVYCHAEDPKDYLKPILIVCIMNFILVAAQMAGHDFMWKHTQSLCGFMGISSQLGQYSAISVPILAFINSWLIIIPLFTLFMSNSISSILATFAGVGLFLILKGANKAIVAGVGALLVLWLSFNFGAVMAKFQCRPIMWEKTLRVALQKPYLGSGYRTFKDEVTGIKAKGSVGGMEYSRAHNDPLHTSQELGFPAMIFVGAFFVGLYKKFKAKKDKDNLTYFLATALIIALINMTGQTFIRYANMAGTFIVLLAFLHIKLEGEKNGCN